MNIRAVAIPAIGLTIVGADQPNPQDPQFHAGSYYPGSYIPRTDSWRVLEYTKFETAEGACDRADAIINEGFTPPAPSPDRGD